MATTSGTATFNYNRNQIILSALRKCGAFQSGDTPDAQSVQDGADALNILVKAWNATGIHIWTEQEGILFPQPNQTQYTLGGTTTDHIADTSNIYTTTTATAASGATTLTVSSISGILANDNIGVVLDSGTTFWTTVSGSPSGSIVTLAASLPSQASSGANVFDYTTAAIRPLRIIGGRRYNWTSAIEVPLIPLSRIDYRNMPNKSYTGVITQFFYDPRGGANTQGVVYLWPTPVDVTNAFKFTWMRPLQDFTTAANIPDLPTEWLDALVWNLAVKLGPEYDIPPQRYAMLKEQASSSLDMALGWDREPESVYFGVNFDQR